MVYYAKPPFNWDDARVELLRNLWDEGLSASQIGRRLGGVTRSAVCGKADRLGLTSRSTISRPRGDGTRMSPAKPTPYTRRFNPSLTEKVMATAPPPEILEPLLIDGKPLRFPDSSEKTCRWIIGNATADAIICGHPPKPGSVYCPGHTRLAYQPQHDQRRRHVQSEKIAGAAE